MLWQAVVLIVALFLGGAIGTYVDAALNLGANAWAAFLVSALVIFAVYAGLIHVVGKKYAAGAD